MTGAVWSQRAADAAFIVALAAVGTLAAWPIYADGFLLVTASAAVLLGGATAALGTWRRLSAPMVALIALGVVVVVGVPLAVPSALRSASGLPGGERQLVVALIAGWKQLVTIALPVGSYQALLVPFLLVMLGSTTAALSLAWRTGRAAPVAVPVMLLPVLFGLAFGSSVVSAPLRLGSWSLPAPRETVVGVLAVLLGGGFLLWRAQRDRQAALRRAAAGSGVRSRRSGSVLGRLRRVGLGAAVCAVALAVAVPVSASALRPPERKVLRTAVAPALQLRRYVSPLTEYRASFQGAAYDRPLFTVRGDLAAVPRLRLAVLDHYDGTAFSAVGPGAAIGGGTTDFARVPQLARPGTGTRLTVTVDGYSGVWAPSAAGVDAVSFSGRKSEALADGYYYDPGTQAGVDLARLARGDSYTLVAAPASRAPALADLTAPTGVALLPRSLIPQSLTAWVAAQHVPQDATGLATLIDRLRQRGYLSHSLVAPTGSGSWLADLDGAGFAPSFAGESLGRIGQLFSDLLARQQAMTSQADADLVAAVGDDEQFSVAAALLAEDLGFPARVVLGFALDPSATDADTPPACAGGVCEGKDLTAWVEVQGASGRWADVAVTPQHEHPLAPTASTEADPKNPTDVTPQTATEQQPPEANPAGSSQHRAPPRHASGPDLAWLRVTTKAVTGIALVLLVIGSPLLAMLGVKGRRRSWRRRSGSETERIAAGWDELVDMLVDRRVPLPASLSRVEVAERSGSRSAVALAELADEALLGPADPEPGTAAEFWRLVDAERERLRRGTGRGEQLSAVLSPRSFLRAVRGGRGG